MKAARQLARIASNLGTWRTVAVKRFLLILVAVLVLLVVVPPTWNALFPTALPDLPAPGVSVIVREGAAVNVLDTGTGQPVVLVHGLPGSAYDW